ncbi:MAG: ABC transporter ATP-binding protein [Chlamydiales bacterium]|nr:ABC transporter ATP-binding protein [Chlamydiales bacterium]
MKKLLKVSDLKKYFPVRRGIFRRRIGEVKAVDGVSFSIDEGEVVGLVGESGSGKSTLGRAVIRLIEPTYGEIEFLGEDFRAASPLELRRLRSKVQMVFQDPLASLNPRKTVLDNVGEPLLFHKRVASRQEQVEEVKKILGKIGISPSTLDHYPHQFSGGQQQRLSIGRAIGLHPKLVICDEAVSALDLSVQAQILNLLQDLKEKLNLSYLFISHDLSVVRHFCDRILVMYRGKVIEEGSTEEIFEQPKEPYTKLLLASAPKKHPRESKQPLNF